MKNRLIARRKTLAGGAAIVAAAAFGSRTGRAVKKSVTVGIDVSLTGATAESSKRVQWGAMMAFDEVNAQGGINGYKFAVTVYDDGTATAGQYDPAQAAVNARKMVANKAIVAAIGPQASGAGKAMAPILSAGDLATITPSSTNPDITDPKFAAQYRPEGKAIYFRTVATDAFQGPYMANYYSDVLKVKALYILDDSGAYGVGLADAFQQQALKKGIKVLGRDRLDPIAPDYGAVLTKIKSVNADALYYGGSMLCAVKLAKQAYDIVPTIIKGGGDGVATPEMLLAVGYPANEGWYATTASPHITEEARMATWMAAYKSHYGVDPNDYAVTAYDAATVIIAAVKAASDGGKEPTRSAVRDAIQAGKVNTLQGPVSFDANGDLADKTISVFQIKRDAAYPSGDMRQFRYIGVAPTA